MFTDCRYWYAGSGLPVTAAACIVVADFVTTKFHLKNKYNAKRKYD